MVHSQKRKLGVIFLFVKIPNRGRGGTNKQRLKTKCGKQTKVVNTRETTGEQTGGGTNIMGAINMNRN